MLNVETLKFASKEDLLALIAKLQSQPAQRLTVKVNEKGTVSVYGLQRFPVTLYPSQWERLLAAKDNILAVCKTAPAAAKAKVA